MFSPQIEDFPRKTIGVYHGIVQTDATRGRLEEVVDDEDIGAPRRYWYTTKMYQGLAPCNGDKDLLLLDCIDVYMFTVLPAE
jgi:hypothetical protein